MAGNNDPRSDDDMLLSFDAPAFVRRAWQVEAAWNGLLEACRSERELLLEMPRMRLARFLKLLQTRPLGPSGICSAQDFAYLSALHQEWKPRLRSAVKPARTDADHARALSELCRSFER